MDRLTLRLLGGFHAELGAGIPLPLTARKAQALLAYLAVRPGHGHPRDKLATLLWPDTSDDQARQSLRVALVALRRALSSGSPTALVAETESLSLAASAADVDVVAFERCIAEGTADALAEAGRLYRGDFLEGFRIAEQPFEEWLTAERARLHELALDALAKLLQHQQAKGPAEPAVQTALRLLALDPLQEAVHRALMRLHVQQGRRGAALKQYQTCVAVLRRELSADPEIETRRLYQEIVRQANRTDDLLLVPAEASRAQASSAARAQHDLPAGETPLFGREAELEPLRTLLEEAVQGRGHLAVITGEAGIGKTRLLDALAKEALERGCRVLVGRCHESDSILPFGPWVEACRSGGVSINGDILDSLPATWRAELGRLLPEATEPGLPSPSQSDLRLFEAVAQLVEQATIRQPVVLMLEDLHWADEMSLRLLAFVARRLRDWRVLLATTAREEDLADSAMVRRTLNELARVTEPPALLKLSSLSQPDTNCLVRALARAGSDARTLTCLEEQVWGVSEGNPFVAVETTRELQERPALPNARTPLSQRVAELITSRLERLSDCARELASVAAVIGRQFEFPLLHRAAGFGEHATAEGVEELVRRYVLRGKGEWFEFGHDRIRTVVYDRLLPPQRKVRHRRVAEALEVLHAGEPEQDSLALGTHFSEGEVWDKAVRYLRQAGAKAFLRSAHREAATCFERALDALRRLPEHPDALAESLDIRFDLRNALLPLGELARMGALLDEAEALAEAVGDERRLVRALNYKAIQFVHAGDLAAVLQAGRRVLAIGESQADIGTQVVANVYLGRAYVARGECREGVRHCEAAISLIPEHLAQERFGQATIQGSSVRFTLAISLGALGRFAEAFARLREAMHIAEEAGHAYTLLFPLVGLGILKLDQGDFAGAVVPLERSLDLCRTREVPLRLPEFAWALGAAYHGTGRRVEGIALMEDAARGIAERSVRMETAWAGRVGALGGAYLRDGRLADAARIAQDGLAKARQLGERGVEGQILRLLGDIAAHPDRFEVETAEAHYRQALALADALGLRPLLAHCHRGLGNLYRCTGPREQAREHLTIATTMYREMDIRFWLERAEAEMKELA